MGLAADFAAPRHERARRARARPRRPSRARQPAAQPRHERARRAAGCGHRDARRGEPGDVRAVVVSGRGERAFCAGSHVGEFEGTARPRGPGAAPARGDDLAGAGRAADADDRRDRGQRPRRRAGAGAVLRHPRRLGAGEAGPPGGPAGGHPRQRRDAAAAAGRRSGTRQGADPDRARDRRRRGVADRPRRRGRRARPGRRAGATRSGPRSPPAGRSPCARPSG